MNNIKKIMLNKNITFTKLQELTFISKSTLSPLVNSEKIPLKTKLDTLVRISKALGVSLSDILENTLDLLDFKIELLPNTENHDFFNFELTLNDYWFSAILDEKEYFSLEGKKYEKDALEIHINFDEQSNIPNSEFMKMWSNTESNELRLFCENILTISNVSLKRTGMFELDLHVSSNNSFEICSYFNGMYNKESNVFSLGRYDKEQTFILKMPK